MTETFVIPLWLDLTAVAVGGVQGAMFASRFREQRLDVLGVALLGVLVGLGGGLIRDILIGVTPAAMQSNGYLLVVTAASLVGMLLLAVFTRLGAMIIGLDALTIGLFGAIGATKALHAGLPEIPAVFIGVVSAVGGSVLRDMILDVPVAVMHVGSLYAVAAGAGTIVLVVILRLGGGLPVAVAVGIALTTIIRLLSVRYGWSLPQQRAIGSWPSWRRR